MMPPGPPRTSAARIQAVERTLRRAIGEVETHREFYVFRCPRFPSFYGGTGVQMRYPERRTLAEWIILHRQVVPRAIFHHTYLTCSSTDNSEPLIASALRAHFLVERECYLALTRPIVQPLLDNMAVHDLCSERHWLLARELDHREATTQPWYADRADSDVLFEHRRALTSAARIRWYYFGNIDGTTMHAKLGVFTRNSIAYLLGLTTDPRCRRRGMALALLTSVISGITASTPKVSIALCTTVGTPAERLFKNVGFTAVGDAASLLLPPEADGAWHLP